MTKPLFPLLHQKLRAFPEILGNSLEVVAVVVVCCMLYVACCMLLLLLLLLLLFAACKFNCILALHV